MATVWDVQQEILAKFKELSIPDRLTLVESVLYLIREDLQHAGQPLSRAERKRRLAAAAEALLPEYLAGGELTAFSVLDGEDFYAEGRDLVD